MERRCDVRGAVHVWVLMWACGRAWLCACVHVSVCAMGMQMWRRCR